MDKEHLCSGSQGSCCLPICSLPASHTHNGNTDPPVRITCTLWYFCVLVVCLVMYCFSAVVVILPVHTHATAVCDSGITCRWGAYRCYKSESGVNTVAPFVCVMIVTVCIFLPLLFYIRVCVCVYVCVCACVCVCMSLFKKLLSYNVLTLLMWCCTTRGWTCRLAHRKPRLVLWSVINVLRVQGTQSVSGSVASMKWQCMYALLCVTLCYVTLMAPRTWS